MNSFITFITLTQKAIYVNCLSLSVLSCPFTFLPHHSLKLREKLPHLTGREATRIITRQCHMIAIKRRPLCRILAAIIHSGDPLATATLGLRGILTLAAVVLDEAVANLAALGDVQYTVANAVLLVKGNGVVASCAAGERGAGENGDGAEVLCVAAGEGEGHGAAVREA